MLHYFKNSTEIVYGSGSASRVGEILKPYKKALTITDQGCMKANLLGPVQKSLVASGIAYEVFAEVEPNPAVEVVEQACELLQSFGADVIVAVGGGSSLDTAKAVGILATNGGKITEYEGVERVPVPAMPVVGIPTTAGTGSEVTINVVITDKAREYKFTIVSRNSACRYAVLDPELTVSMPPGLTAATGMDALTHAIESYTSLMSYPLSATLALEAIKIITRNLALAVYNGDNLVARDGMLMGCLMASLAFNNTRLGNAHAMSHPISAVFGVPHGIANAILLPYVMEFNSVAVPDRFAAIAEAMGEDNRGLKVTQAAARAVEAVRELSQRIEIPSRLSAVISDPNAKDKIDKLADDAMKSGNIAVNPRKTTRKDIVALFEQAW
ncbi:MAG: iron-containing alcohol dehydrogenase [bacterium]